MQDVGTVTPCPLPHAHYHCNDTTNAPRYHLHLLLLHHTMDSEHGTAGFQKKFPSTVLKCKQLQETDNQLSLDSKARQASDERRNARPQLCPVYNTMW